MTTEKPSRRNLLRGGLSAAALAAFGVPTLTGCGSGSATSGSNAKVKLPDYIPFTGGPEPDLKGGKMLPEGFYSYPTDLVKSVKDKPMNGGGITAMANIFEPVPPARADNVAWRAVEERLGGKVDLTIVPASDYETKTSTKIASDDLPDLMMFNATGINNVPRFAQAKCVDLEKFIGGDKVADYPNLANIPTAAWKGGIKGGRLYGLPIPREGTGGCGFVNMRYFTPLGLRDLSEIRDADEFLDVLKEVTGNGVYGVGTNSGGAFALNLWNYIFRVPYDWKLSKGKLTKNFETDEYAASVEYARKLNDAGVFVPGSEGADVAKKKTSFIAGKAAMIYDGLPALYDYAPEMAAHNEDNNPVPFVPFGHDGGEGTCWLDNTVMAITFVTKQDSDDEVRRLLRVADFLAAPFGSREHLLINYGVEGKDHRRDSNGNPELTRTGAENINVPWKYLCAGPSVLHNSRVENPVIDAYHSTLKKLLPSAVENPVENHYSSTDDKKGRKLRQEVTDVVTSIIAGREKMSALEPAVEKWRSDGGDKIRDEFETVLAEE